MGPHMGGGWYGGAPGRVSALPVSPGKDERLVTVRLHPCPPPDFFRPCRLLPSKNNVRSAWYRGQSPPGDGKWPWYHGGAEGKDVVGISPPMASSLPPTGSPEPPTPHYNAWVLQDMTLESHMQLLSTVLGSALGLKDGVALLKVWLRQRELDKVSWEWPSFPASLSGGLALSLGLSFHLFFRAWEGSVGSLSPCWLPSSCPRARSILL